MIINPAFIALFAIGVCVIVKGIDYYVKMMAGYYDYSTLEEESHEAY